jgi:dihydrofolate reductase
VTRLVWAQSEAGVIGRDGGLPWQLPEDMALFRALTVDGTVVMGRGTWESLPERFRPLPRRRNLVLSRTVTALDGAEVIGPDDVPNDAWVIGGEQVYAALISTATLAVTTIVGGDHPGDAYAPVLGAGWRSSGRPWFRAADGLVFTVRVSGRDGADTGPLEGVVEALAAGWTPVG